MASTKTHGYSGKPLFQKLSLKPGMICLLIKAPKHYPALVSDAVDVRFIRKAGPADAVHVFCRRKSEVSPLFERALGSAGGSGMIWVSWPKKTSALYHDLTEQDLRDHVLPLGWVDVKVCAVDEDWSGLKFVKRKA